MNEICRKVSLKYSLEHSNKSQQIYKSFISNNPYIFISKFISILWKIPMTLFNILINL